MSSISNVTKEVWCRRILHLVDNFEVPVTDWKEYNTEESATQGSIEDVQFYIELTGEYHCAEIVKRVVPIYI